MPITHTHTLKKMACKHTVFLLHLFDCRFILRCGCDAFDEFDRFVPVSRRKFLLPSAEQQVVVTDLLHKLEIFLC